MKNEFDATKILNVARQARRAEEPETLPDSVYQLLLACAGFAVLQKSDEEDWVAVSPAGLAFGCVSGL